MVMDRDFLIKLTNALYRLTLLFPKKEPLRYKIREVADCILAKPEEGDFETLDSFFEVAKNQSWVSDQNVLAVQAEYANLREELNRQSSLVSSFAKTTEDKKETENNDNPVNSGFKTNHNVFLAQSIVERQAKILAFLKENGRAQVWQIKEILPDVTKRTLRRDFDSMLNQGVIERVGERNNTFYQMKTETV